MIVKRVAARAAIVVAAMVLPLTLWLCISF